MPEFAESNEPKLCPYCEQELTDINYEFCQKVIKLGRFERRSIVILSCPHCRKVLTATGIP